MSLCGQNLLSAINQNDPTAFGLGNLNAVGGSGKGGSVLPPETLDPTRIYIAPQPTAMNPFNNVGRIVDPTLLAQQAILARPMRPSFAGQPLLSREVPMPIQGGGGLAYPSMPQSAPLSVPSYTSRYAGTDSGGGGGGGVTPDGYSGPATYGSNQSLSNGLVGSLLGLSSQPAYGITVENMGTYANQPAYGYGSAMTGEGNPGESYGGGYNSSDYGGYSGSETQSGGEAYAN